MVAVIAGRWHAWDANHSVLLSDQETGQLYEFASWSNPPDRGAWDDVVNWLFVKGYKEEARSINAQVRASIEKKEK